MGAAPGERENDSPGGRTRNEFSRTGEEWELSRDWGKREPACPSGNTRPETQGLTNSSSATEATATQDEDQHERPERPVLCSLERVVRRRRQKRKAGGKKLKAKRKELQGERKTAQGNDGKSLAGKE